MTTESEMDILLVEDNPRDAELASRALQNCIPSARIGLFRDGAEVLSWFFDSEGAPMPSRGHPAVVLLDIKLPKVDGLEVLRKLKEDTSTQLIPVVMLTSSREESDLARSYMLGANSFIVKPVDCDKYAEALTQIGFYWLRFNQTPAVPNPKS